MLTKEMDGKNDNTDMNDNMDSIESLEKRLAVVEKEVVSIKQAITMLKNVELEDCVSSDTGNDIKPTDDVVDIIQSAMEKYKVGQTPDLFPEELWEDIYEENKRRIKKDEIVMWFPAQFVMFESDVGHFYNSVYSRNKSVFLITGTSFLVCGKSADFYESDINMKLYESYNILDLVDYSKMKNNASSQSAQKFSVSSGSKNDNYVVKVRFDREGRDELWIAFKDEEESRHYLSFFGELIEEFNKLKIKRQSIQN